MKPNGVILYQGDSLLTEFDQVVAIATFNSSNSGTGNMIQTWIMHAEINPIVASKAGYDAAVCGSCPHRHHLGGGCYVNLGQAPSSVWRAYKRGAYPVYDTSHASLFENRHVRIGSYGDPASVPVQIWQTIIALADGYTGYTHQIRHPNFDPAHGELFMVSADTPNQARAYNRAGYNTFRVKREGSELLEDELDCPKQSGQQCIDCQLCGTFKSRNIAIDVHGPLKGRYDRIASSERIPVHATYT